MNIELAYNILDILHTMHDAVKQMKEEYINGRVQIFNQISMDVWDGLIVVQELAKTEVPEGSRIRLADACTCALESLKDIKKLAIAKPTKLEWKLEYELAPIIETTAMQFYYWGIVEEHPEKRESFLKFITDTETFNLLKEPRPEELFSYDLTIMVTAYNHLDFTIKCVQSILENMPKEIMTQLIVFNHGSTDNTKAYFENLEDIKVINVAVNGIMPFVFHKAISMGRYNLAVSNDIVIGENAIDNLYRCAVENADYGYIVPATPAVSNLQMIDIKYDSLEGFKETALKNNIYDEKRHEQRIRLCNPLHLMPTTLSTQLVLDMYEDKCCNRIKMSFPDDKNSLWMRRHGYKCILAKDAYCHHFGSVTLKHDLGTQQDQRKFYEEGRKIFQSNYGVDPWGTGACYDLKLFQTWNFPVTDQAYILGINCGLGSNSLKVKEILKEKGTEGAVLYNGTQNEVYLQDLKGISDEAFLFSDLSDIAAKTEIKHFHYIVVEDPIQGIVTENLVKEMQNADLCFDELAYKTLNGEWKIVKGATK